MAIFHLTAKVISRGKGQSAIAAAAYRSGERLRDEQANEQKFYQARAERIEFTAIMAPKDAPEWAHDRNQLWNHVERAEKRKDAQLSREIEISLPHELTPQQREWLVKDFAREAFVRKGYAVDIAIHAPDKKSDDRNHHAHIMVTMRMLDGDGFAAKKDPSMNRREQLGEWREQWAHLANRHLERHGHEARIDHRSLKEQGVEREAGIHLGYAVNEMAQRGAQSDRMDALQQVIARNDIRVEVGKIERELAQLERAEKAQTRDAAPPPVPEKKEHNSERQAEPPRQHSENKNTQASTVAPPKSAAREAFTGKDLPRVTQGGARAVGGVAGGATKIAAKALDGLASAFESSVRRRFRQGCGTEAGVLLRQGFGGQADLTAAARAGASTTRAGASVSAEAPCGQGESLCRGGAAGTRGASPRIVTRLRQGNSAGRRARRGD